MKRLLLLFTALVLMGSTLSAQIAPGMKYKDLKGLYSARNYVKSPGDPYSTFWAGAASLVVPGLGQVVCGETGRGLGIFAGNVALGIGANVCANRYLSYAKKDARDAYVRDDNGNLVMTDDKAAMKWGLGLLGVCLVGAGYDIWNICDAVRVAKVKNQYFNDLQRHSFDMDLYPTLDYAMTAQGVAPVAGLSLSVKF